MKGFASYRKIFSLLRITPFEQKVKFYILGSVVIFSSVAALNILIAISPRFATRRRLIFKSTISTKITCKNLNQKILGLIYPQEIHH